MLRLPNLIPIAGLCFCLGGTILAGSAAPLPQPGDAEFERSVAPVLARSCLSCHNASDPKGGLDLTHAESFRKGGDSGPVVISGKPDGSYLVRRLREGSMPPQGMGARLTAAEVNGITGWVRRGAAWPAGRVLSPFERSTDRRAGRDWWSLQPVRRPEVPTVKRAGWVRNPIDAFILQRLERAGFTPAPEADRATYIRRATLDLLGLPPTPAEIDAFVHDRSPDAYEKLVDRLLASPHYGERWGRHWLDVARFGESDGFEDDRPRDHAWRYRDWVIDALNQDLPYDQFVRKQIAGDVAEPRTRDGLIATGFLVAGPWDEIQNVAASKLERQRAHEEQLEELVGTVGQGFLGLTLNCARCHDHKFDPIPQQDYYRVKAIFDGVDAGNQSILSPQEQTAHDAVVTPIQARIQQLEPKLEALKPGGIVPDRLAAGSLGDGVWGEALDARKGVFATASRPAFTNPPITVECWARLKSRGGFNILVANNPKESSEHWEIYSYAGSGELSAYFPGFEPAEIKSGVPITDDRWHYVAMQWDGGHVRLCIDGKVATDTPIVRRRSGGALGQLYLGAYPPHRIPCDGLIDEVRISQGLRPIDAVPAAPFTPDARTLALWHLDRNVAEKTSTTGEADEFARRTISLALLEARNELASHPTPMTYCGVRRQPEATVIYQRGEVTKPGPAVVPGAPSALTSLPGDLGLDASAPEAERRRRFAEWVASPKNPLTARVIVNRVWQYHFGEGIVGTPSDFGFNGGRPSHPELLDFLASVFVSGASTVNECGSVGVAGYGSRTGSRVEGSGVTSPSFNATARKTTNVTPPKVGRLEGRDSRTAGLGWSLKKLHRLIMLSAAYRMSSGSPGGSPTTKQPSKNPQTIKKPALDFAAQLRKDADNRLVWHFAPRRLEAETVRDAMLAVSGELNPQVGGPSFRPFTTTVFNTTFYHVFDSGEPEFNRRSIYRMSVDTGKIPFLDALDCPAPSITAPKRRSTSTALQALALMNDPFLNRQAEKFAGRVRREAGERPEAAVTAAYRIALGRPPDREELTEGQQLVRQHGLPSLCWALLNSSEFLYLR